MLQETSEIQLLKRNKELLDELSLTKRKLMELEIKFEDSYVKKLTKINREKEDSIIEALSALTFYADESNYTDYEEFGEPSSVEVDSGKRAKKAIKVIKNNA